jgi:integrase/recombinase XerC
LELSDWPVVNRELVLDSDWHEPGRRKLQAVKAASEGREEHLSSLLNTYLSYRGRKGAQTSSRTRQTYETALADWLSYCWPSRSDSPLVALLRATRDDVERYLALLQERVSLATAATYLAGVRALYRALLWAQAVSANPADGVRAPVDPRPRHERRDPVPLDGYRAMLELAGDRDRLLLRMMGDQGLRISEVAALDLADVRGGIVIVQRGKGGKRRRVPMTRPTGEALRAWLQVRQAVDGEVALFVNAMEGRTRQDLAGRRMSSGSIRTAFQRLRKAAGLPDGLSPHSLRHTAGTRLYKASRDLYVVSQALGHSDVNTSSIYAKMDLEGLNEAMSRLEESP